MKIALKPLSHPEIGDILVSDAVFPIGRRNAPFAGLDTSLISDLSRRHARVFQENGIAYIADLGSLNGTTLNREPVDNQPQRINHGDEICLAGKFRYRVDIETPDADNDATAILEKPTDTQVILTPTDTESGLETVAINKLPFLISKSTGVFASYRLAFESEVKHISRRHAYIFLNEGEVMVEDLGSTNGTFLSNQKLDEHPRILSSGNVISFGGEFFAYSVEIIPAQGEQTDSNHLPHVKSEARKSENPSQHTTYVIESNPFVDIFSDDDEFESPRAPNEQPLTASPSDTRKPPMQTGKKSIFGKIGGVFSRSAKETGDVKPTESKLWRILAFMFCLGIVAVIGFTYLGGPERKIKSLFLQERYAESAKLAAEYLQTDRANKAVMELGTRAILNTTVPVWREHLQMHDFDAANGVLKSAEDDYPNNPDAKQALDLLRWIIRVNESKNSIPEGQKVNLFSQGESIKELAEWWENNEQKNLRSLEKISRDVTAFKDIYRQTLGDLRTLKKQRDAYAKTNANLVEQLHGKLDEGKIDEIDQAIGDFERKHKKITGIKVLRSDLNNLLQLKDAVTNKQLDQVLSIREQSPFRTPLFSEYAAATFDQDLPTAELIKRYRDAIGAWQNGDVDRAIRSLTAISEQPWGNSAKQKLKRYQTILAEYQVLLASQKDPDFNKKLMAFRGRLEMPEDKFIAKTIDANFKYLKTDAMKDAKAAVFASKQQWDEYKQQGGINGLTRLEKNISDSFETQAKRLGRAKDGIQTAVRIYEKINETPPPEWSQFYGSVLDEINNQRNHLKELSGTMDASLLERKLQLIDATATR